MKNKKYLCFQCNEELNTFNDVMLIFSKGTKAICFSCLDDPLMEQINNGGLDDL